MTTTDPTARESAIEALIQYGIGSGMGYPYGAASGALDVVIAAGYRPAHEVAAECAEIVSAINLDYLQKDGLSGQRGFSIESTAAIRAVFLAPTDPRTTYKEN